MVASAPTTGSVGEHSGGSQRSFCSGVPSATMGPAKKPPPPMQPAIAEQPQASSSMIATRRDQAVDAATAVLLGQVVAGQPDLGRLADDRPRELLGLVVLVRQRPHLALGELVRHRLQIALDVV